MSSLISLDTALILSGIMVNLIAVVSWNVKLERRFTRLETLMSVVQGIIKRKHGIETREGD